VNVGDIETVLKSLGDFLAAHQGKKPAEAFETFRLALEPFRNVPLNQFAQLLRQAEEYRRTGILPVGAKKAPREKKPAQPKAPKVPLKTKSDTEAIRQTVAELQKLYERATDPTLGYGEIETTVERISKEFDTSGLKAVAKEFGAGSGSKTKDAARSNIEEKIKARKGRHERNEAASPVPTLQPPPAPAPGPAPLPAPEAVPGEPIEAEVDSDGNHRGGPPLAGG
jgi:hypothetical protein